MTLLASASAHAECSMDSDEGNGFACSILFSSLMTSIAPTVAPSSSSVAENRETYVNVVREDAAEFIATNGQGVASALLKDVMNQMREKTSASNQVTDLQIAKLVAADFN